jgi:outer membrane receptor protein involved in Fe transport
MLLGVEGQNNSRADQATYDFANAGAELLIPSQGYRAGVYVQDEWQFSPRWRTTVGARVDRNNVTGTKASPRVGLIWQATDKTALKALFGRAWRAPNAYESLFGDGTTLLANLQLKGERNDTLEMLVEHQLTNGISFRASVYQWDIQHLITLGIDPLTGVPVYENSLGVESQAFELAMNGTWSSGARLWASIAYQDVGYEEGGVVANSPTELAKVAYAVPLPALGVRIAWELQYDGERQTLAGRSVGGDWLSHAVVSSLQAWQGLSWSLALRNMFDRDYELPAADTNWQDALQQQGRQLRLIVNYRF